jgi:ribonuclease R
VHGEVPDEAGLERIAQGLNVCERSAVEAEREIFRRLSVIYMADRIGEVFDAVITGVIDFGFFVECKEVMVEGMVRLSSISSDYFRFDPVRQELQGERTSAVFRLGQPVRVAVREANIGRLEIDFSLYGEQWHARRTKQASGKGMKKENRARPSGARAHPHRKAGARNSGTQKKHSSRKGAFR